MKESSKSSRFKSCSLEESSSVSIDAKWNEKAMRKQLESETMKMMEGVPNPLLNPPSSIWKEDLKYFIDDHSPFYPPLKINWSPGIFPDQEEKHSETFTFEIGKNGHYSHSVSSKHTKSD